MKGEGRGRAWLVLSGSPRASALLPDLVLPVSLGEGFLPPVFSGD